jgi:hypothetical protein
MAIKTAIFTQNTDFITLLLPVFLTYVDCKWGDTLSVFQLLCHLETKFQRLPPIFSRASNLLETLGILHDQTGSGKFKMAAADAEILISQLADVIAKKFRRLPPHLRSPAIL